MKIIDTHSHIFAEQFDDDIEEVIERAKKAGIYKILMPNVDTFSIEPLNLLASSHPDFCLPMMGLHPTSIDKNWRSQLAKMSNMLTKHPYIAIGEIGLDFYWDRTYEVEQIMVFKEQLMWSIDYNLPVSIHSRNATHQALKCIKQVGESKLRGVFHSFSGTDDELRDIYRYENFMIGINGIITFKNSSLPIALKGADLSRIVIETDAPYLAPASKRGKRNEPAYLVEVVNKLAEIYNTTPENVAEITTMNAQKMFGFD